MRKSLPVGVQTFSTMIERNYLYIDKTRDIYNLITTGQVYFLSRPRRFGKTLLISTLAEIFAGHRELFEGLWIDGSDYAWEAHPVVRIDFSQVSVTIASELKDALTEYLDQIAAQHNIVLEGSTYYFRFSNLIQQLATQNTVVVLIDEYDKPLIDNVEDVAEARRIREVLKGFYTILKAMDEHLRFVLLTGVSKFSKVGVFSGLNNLKDITLDNRFATLLGVTEQEIDRDLGEYVQAFAQSEGMPVDKLRAEIRSWYDGFCFSKRCLPVYNPFSLLLLLDMQDFRNYWFETGTPTFLIKLIKEKGYNIQLMDNLLVDELAFSSYEVGDLGVIPLLFQTGYLTIKGYDPETRLYRLYYPNYEVENAFSKYLLSAFTPVKNGLVGSYLQQLAQAMRAQDWESFFETLQVFFADIPYDIQLSQEKYYQSIFYLIFKLIGLHIDAEVRTNRGRIDAVIEMDAGVFIFEFKLDGSADEALAQIKARGYAEKYATRDDVTLIGVAFSTEARGVEAWQIERAT
jgi:hypothetical protein